MTGNFISEVIGFIFVALALWAVHYNMDQKIQKSVTQKFTKTYGDFLIGLSILLFFIAAFQFYHDFRFYFYGQKATAIVTEGFPEDKFRYSYTFQINSEETIQGEGHYMKGCRQRNICSPGQGERVTIEYLPSSPNSNRIVGTYFSFMMILPFLLLFWGIKYRNKETSGPT
jgi:hypothetical protein